MEIALVHTSYSASITKFIEVIAPTIASYAEWNNLLEVKLIQLTLLFNCKYYYRLLTSGINKF